MRRHVKAALAPRMPRIYLALILLAGAMSCLGGCATAGLSAELLSLDAISRANQEAIEGVGLYDQALAEAAARDHREYLAKLGADVAKIALSKDETPESAATLAAAVSAGAAKHYAAQAEDARRRRKLFDVTMDNLAYGIEVAQDVRAFILFRSNVARQWKQYIAAVTAGRYAPKAEGD